MELKEVIDLDTGDHRFIISIAAREIMLISDVGKNLPRELTDSQKLSDKLLILHITARNIEELDACMKAKKEWPL